MNIYHYNRITKEFSGESYAKLDPLESELQGTTIYLIPKYVTTEEPPMTGNDEVAVFEDESWVVKEDHRGKTVFDRTTTEPTVIDKIGSISNDFTLEAPIPFALWNGTTWITDTDKETKALNEEKIQKEIRETAINNLISKGELPIDYK